MLPDDRGQPVPHGAVGVRGAQHDRLVHQPDQGVEDLVRAKVVARARLFRGGEVEAIGEDRQPGPQQPLGGRAQVEAPADGRLQGSLALACARAAVPEQPQVTGKPGEQFVKADGAQPERRELDRERDAVKHLAEPHDLGQRLRGHLESWVRRPRPVGEQADRVVGIQRTEAEDHLAGQVERLAAGHHQHRAVAAAQDRVGEQCAGVDDVLAGVQDEQQVLAA